MTRMTKPTSIWILYSWFLFSTLLNQLVISACERAGLLVVQNRDISCVVTQHSQFCPKLSKPPLQRAIVEVVVLMPSVQVVPKQVDDVVSVAFT